MISAVTATVFAMSIGFTGVVMAAIGLYVLAGAVFRAPLSAAPEISQQA